MVAQYFDQKTTESRAKLMAEARAKGKAEWLDWYGPKEGAEARCELFDEPEPGDEEAVAHTRATGDQKLTDEYVQNPTSTI